jgi:hypothetical protein
MAKRVCLTNHLKGMTMTIEFVKDKETKNTIRFTATGDVSGSVYVQKDSDLANETVISMEIAKSEAAA